MPVRRPTGDKLSVGDDDRHYVGTEVTKALHHSYPSKQP
jgi:hypothetical protein